MNQWEKYDVDMLLDIADSTNAPDVNGEWYCGEMFDAKDGWKVSIFYDCGELDYIEYFVAPDGEVIDFWKLPDTYLPDDELLTFHFAEGVRMAKAQSEAMRGVKEAITALFLDEMDAANAWLDARNSEFEAFARGQEKA